MEYWVIIVMEGEEGAKENTVRGEGYRKRNHRLMSWANRYVLINLTILTKGNSDYISLTW